MIFDSKHLKLSFGEKYSSKDGDKYFVVLGHAYYQNKKCDSFGLINKIFNNGDFLNLNGAFIICRYENKNLQIVTDKMGFIPFYLDKEKLIFGDNPKLFKKSYYDSDKISVYELIYREYITHPYTFWENVRKVDPATVYTYDIRNNKLSIYKYWEIECNVIDDYDTCVEILGNALNESIKQRTTSNTAFLVSAGLDSRIFFNYVCDRHHYFTFFDDENNKEYIHVKKLINNFSDINHQFLKRSIDHYLNIIDCSLELNTANYDFRHSYTLGFEERLQGYENILTGCYNDVMFKKPFISKEEVEKKIFLENPTGKRFPYFDKFILDHIKEREKKRYRKFIGFQLDQNLMREVTLQRCSPVSQIRTTAFRNSLWKTTKFDLIISDNCVIEALTKIPVKYCSKKLMYDVLSYTNSDLVKSSFSSSTGKNGTSDNENLMNKLIRAFKRIFNTKDKKISSWNNETYLMNNQKFIGLGKYYLQILNNEGIKFDKFNINDKVNFPLISRIITAGKGMERLKK